MGRFKVSELLTMDNPYQELVEQDEEGLAEHTKELNAMKPQEMRQFAAKLVSHCPDDKLSALGLKKEALHHPKAAGTGFYEVLSQAYTIRMTVYGLGDERNKKPYRAFGAEFNADLYNQFPGLLATLTADKEDAIATRLAMTTPEEENILSSLRTIGEHGALFQAVSTAFELRQEIKAKLLSAEAAKAAAFFSSPRCSVDLYNRFPTLVNSLIGGREEELAEKLAQGGGRSLQDIARKLEQLTQNAADKNASMKRLAQAFNAQLEKAEEETASKAGGARQRMGTFAASPVSSIPPEEEEEDVLQSRCFSSCTLF